MIKYAYIIDDDNAVRDSLSFLLETHGFSVTSYASGDIFLETGVGDIAGPILLDVRMPGRDGIETLQEILSLKSSASVIMMSGHADVSMAVRALKHGALDFIEKPFAAADILAALDRLLRSSEQQNKEAQFQFEGLEKLSKLTKREKEVMALLVQGKPNKIVAADLGLSVRTVETHRAHLLSKLDVKSLPDLVRLSLLKS